MILTLGCRRACRSWCGREETATLLVAQFGFRRDFLPHRLHHRRGSPRRHLCGVQSPPLLRADVRDTKISNPLDRALLRHLHISHARVAPSRPVAAQFYRVYGYLAVDCCANDGFCSRLLSTPAKVPSARLVPQPRFGMPTSALCVLSARIDRVQLSECGDITDACRSPSQHWGIKTTVARGPSWSTCG